MKQIHDLQTSLDALFRYCRSREWQGHDPYDALNSRLLKTLTLGSRWIRLAFIQTLKRLPFDPRGLLGVRKNLNPKGLSLFLNGCLALYRLTGEERYRGLCRHFAALLEEVSCRGYSGHCWGYDFDWQSRFFFLPGGTPTTVNTVFAANALLNLHETLKEEHALEMARSACDFLLRDLHRESNGEGICFSYTPLDPLQVYNASILAAQLLHRVHQLCGEKDLLEIGRQASRFVCAHQNEDGSWYYGKAASQRWVDGHHTGFILVALHDILSRTGDEAIAGSLDRGLSFYRRHLFRQDGAPKYYSHRLYPIDTHCAAQGIITFARLRAREQGSLDLARRVAEWTIDNMQDPQGFFYYRKGRLLTNRIPYMRWSQAWMFHALTELVEVLTEEDAVR